MTVPLSGGGWSCRGGPPLNPASGQLGANIAVQYLSASLTAVTSFTSPHPLLWLYLLLFLAVYSSTSEAFSTLDATSLTNQASC